MVIIMPILGWDESPGLPDADAHEALQGPEELLHCRVGQGHHGVDHVLTVQVCSLPLPGDQEAGVCHLCQCWTTGFLK